MAAQHAPSVSSCNFLASYLIVQFVLLIILVGFHPEPCNAARVLPREPASVRATDQFILSSCKSTAYPDLCYSSLSTYASTIQTSPMQLAHTALSVSLDHARSTSADMKKMSATAGGMSQREAAAMSDCMENVGDSIDELRQSLAAMGRLHGGKDLGFQLNSVQTWVSSALTDDTTCMSGLEGSAMSGNLRNSAAVRGDIVNVAKLTSNALALCECNFAPLSPALVWSKLDLVLTF